MIAHRGNGSVAADTIAPRKEQPWASAAIWPVGFLTMISALNYLDRSLLGLLLPLIKADLQLSDTALGLISGLAFAAFYTLLGVPIANLADRSNRRNIVATGLALWSLMTALTGWVASGWQLAVCRFLMGAGEAAGPAPSQAMIADQVPAAKRPLALAVFSTGSAISSLLLTPLIGWIAVSHGWRAAFQTAGVAGIVLAGLFLLTVREPSRLGGGPRPPGVRLWQAVRQLLRMSTYLWMLAGASFMGGAVYAWATWKTTMLVRVRGLTITDVASIVTPLGGIAGLFGILLIGWLADRLSRRDGRWQLWVPGLVCCLCAPAYVLFLLADEPVLWIAGLGIVLALQAAPQAPVYSAVLALVPEGMRAISISVIVLFTGLIGQVFGPFLVGLLSDVLTASYEAEAIRYSLLVVPMCSLIGGLCFIVASLVGRGTWTEAR